ncbi:hypothetical protein [Bacteroides sp.]|uniref:hypothetical protein n=1 Tax=Bacteroides sp. TaxID=29523 RepID=UPI002582BC11|nr:hypothetical protein [Bacteroides sp.]
MDFSTYSDNGYVISINAIDNTLAAIIKAKKSIQYEYPVADLETSNLNYDRLVKKNNAKWIITGDNIEIDDINYVENTFYASGSPTGAQTTYTIPIYITGNPEIDIKDIIEIYDVDKKVVSAYDYSDRYFIKNISEENVSVNIKLNFELDVEFAGEGTPNIRLESYPHDGKVLFYQALVNGKNTIELDKDFIIQPGMIFFFGVMTTTNYVKITQTLPHASNEFVEISFLGRGEPVNIDVISPSTILSKLLASMTENTIEHSSSIDYILSSEGTSIKFNRLLERTYIMAAESARGLPKAKIYTSYKKFCEWMETEFGYVPVINENTVTFMHRDKLFSSTVVKDLGTEINDYEFSVNDSLIYSSVKVGYDKQDYDSINGRDEFRFTNEFSTGLRLTDNTLSLISPYRADAYGIEFLVQKRGEDTTDNDSDNDVFFVECINNLSTGILDLNRPYSEGQLSGLLSPDTMFNLNYSPRFMLEANKKYIGACTDLLKFASSDGNSDVSIDGVKETDDFSIPERLFTVSEVEVETSDIISPDDLLGLVSLNNRGRTVTGYIKQIKSYIGKAKSSSYTLIVKDINISGAQEDKSITVTPQKLAFEEYESKKANVITDPHEISWTTTIKDK